MKSNSLSARLQQNGLVSLAAYLEMLDMSAGQLAMLAGVDESVVLSQPGNAALQRYMLASLGVIDLLVGYGCDEAKAIYWFRNVPLTEFGGGTAEEWLASGREDAIRHYILNLSAGATG